MPPSTLYSNSSHAANNRTNGISASIGADLSFSCALAREQHSKLDHNFVLIQTNIRRIEGSATFSRCSHSSFFRTAQNQPSLPSHDLNFRYFATGSINQFMLSTTSSNLLLVDTVDSSSNTARLQTTKEFREHGQGEWLLSPSRTWSLLRGSFPKTCLRSGDRSRPLSAGPHVRSPSRRRDHHWFPKSSVTDVILRKPLGCTFSRQNLSFRRHNDDAGVFCQFHRRIKRPHQTVFHDTRNRNGTT